MEHQEITESFVKADGGHSEPKGHRGAMGHTPGPWKEAEAIGQSEGRECLRVFSLSDAEIAPANAFGDTREQMKANARLIAAAPEMLEALQAIVADLDLISNLPGGSNELQIMVDAAIAKATGQ